MSSLFSVQGKVAVVTGAGSGLGLMIATAYVQQGCTVYGVGRREVKLKEAADTLSESELLGHALESSIHCGGSRSRRLLDCRACRLVASLTT